jgi:hypothetical protein
VCAAHRAAGARPARGTRVLAACKAAVAVPAAGCRVLCCVCNSTHAPRARTHTRCAAHLSDGLPSGVVSAQLLQTQTKHTRSAGMQAQILRYERQSQALPKVCRHARTHSHARAHTHTPDCRRACASGTECWGRVPRRCCKRSSRHAPSISQA